MKTTFAAFALVSNISAVKIDRMARANPDGYTFNNGVLADSILKTHTDAETARAAAVSAQEKSDAWRAGFTPNSGPVINYVQRQNPNDADTYATTFGKLESELKEKSDKYHARVLWGNQQEEEDKQEESKSNEESKSQDIEEVPKSQPLDDNQKEDLSKDEKEAFAIQL